MDKLYLDASVIIAAILSPNGGSAKLIQLPKLGVIAGITSQTVIEEVEKHSVKIGKTSQEIKQFIKDNAIIVRKRVSKAEAEPYQGLVVEDDVHVLAAARLTRCDYLVTLDKKHLLKEKVRKIVRPLKVVSPKEYLKKLLK